MIMARYIGEIFLRPAWLLLLGTIFLSCQSSDTDKSSDKAIVSTQHKPFLDCFTGIAPAARKVVYDHSTFCNMVFTPLDSMHMLELHLSKNRVSVSNICQTYSLPQQGLTLRISSLSSEGRWQNPCSDVQYGELSILPSYSVVRGQITIALAKFYDSWQRKDSVIVYQPLAKIEDAIFVNSVGKDTIKLKNFMLGYTESPDYKLANQDSPYRVAFPAIKASNLEEIKLSIKEKIIQSDPKPKDFFACVNVLPSGKGRLANIRPGRDSAYIEIVSSEINKLNYPTRQSHELGDDYQDCFLVTF